MILTLQNIEKSYGTQQVLNDISLHVQEGETIAVTGSSGCGKTTLLNIIGGLDKPDAGEVILFGQNLTAMNEKELSVLRNRKIGFVFQQHYLLPQCSLLENILLPTLVNADKEEKKKALQHAGDLMERLGLSDCRNKKPAQMSVGECQRGAFIRAMINRPVLLLADEPTGSLDEETAETLANELLGLNRDYNTTMITVTHAPTLADKMETRYSLKKGGLVSMPLTQHR